MTDTATLLIEIGTEELPPKALSKLGRAFATGISEGLKAKGLNFGNVNVNIASPRRLAVIIEDVPAKQADRNTQKKGPTLKSAFDSSGKPTAAALGFAKSCKTSIENIEKLETAKGSWLVFNYEQKGQAIEKLICEVFPKVIDKLPIPKKMRWSSLQEQFVRPVHWLLAMHGSTQLNLKAYGLTARNITRGHRFHSPEDIKLEDAALYQTSLHEAKVIADFNKRKQTIKKQIEDVASGLSGVAIIDEDLLDEVTGLVEWPVALSASFDDSFLSLPAEALITSMQHHQKCFALKDIKSGKLLAKFILISNIAASDPSQIIHGNERVMDARLADAKFFFDQDQKTHLGDRIDGLKQVVFQKQLGSLYDKTQRVVKLSSTIAEHLDADQEIVKRAALLCKADLLTDMVGEFPELEGIMGSYYARIDGETEEVAIAQREIYLPRFSGDTLPQSITGTILSIADKLDSLVGAFSIGQIPTGDKDPFGLRRAALGVLRIMVEKKLPLDLLELIRQSYKLLNPVHEEAVPTKVLDFCFDRFRAWFQDDGINPKIIDAVMATNPTKPYDFSQRVQAVNHFLTLPQAESLALANKRVRNILTKSGIRVDLSASPYIDENILTEDAEKNLKHTLEDLKQKTQPLIGQGEYTQALTVLATLKEPVDNFFDSVMVMVEEEDVKNNRINLLNNLYNLFMQVADVSKLST